MTLTAAPTFNPSVPLSPEMWAYPPLTSRLWAAASNGDRSRNAKNTDRLFIVSLSVKFHRAELPDRKKQTASMLLISPKLATFLQARFCVMMLGRPPANDNCQKMQIGGGRVCRRRVSH